MAINGLAGVNNPIFQASQLQAQQSGQEKNMAIQGIINQTTQREAEKLGARLKTYATFMQSKDPFIFQKGVEGMYGAMDEQPPEDIMSRQEEMRTAWGELSRLEGKIPTNDFKEMVTSTMSRFGGVPEGMGERAQVASETEALGQAAGLTPEDPLIRAGEAGVDVIKERLKPGKEPGSLDAILAQKVMNKEMTIEEAFEHKRKATPSTTVNVDTGKKFWGELGKLGAEGLEKERDTALNAAQSISTIQEGRNFLNQGAYSGSAANIKLGLDKWLNEAGINIGGRTAANTESYAALMGKEVGQVIKLFGSGTGLSDADREYAEKIAAGKVTLTEDAKRKLLGIHEKLYRAKIRGYNKKAKQVMKSPEYALPFSIEIEEPNEARNLDSMSDDDLLKALER